ncbi:pyridoxine 5'-phosphate synthase [Planctomycetes bacterium Pla163]
MAKGAPDLALRLHVNVDHVATVRQARRARFPDPTEFALACEAAGADGITVHLRKDRRHIQDDDVQALRGRIGTLLNLECSLDDEMVDLACDSGADAFCLVPENRAEVTTEGGLDVIAESARLATAVPRLGRSGGLVSLFVDPDLDQIRAAAATGAPFIELHTGRYANTVDAEREAELERLRRAAELAHELGLRVNAGHGLDLVNVGPVARIAHLEELNIGHALVARALFVGAGGAVREMRVAMGLEG